MLLSYPCFSFFFFNDTATTEIYTLSLHDALPIYLERVKHLALHVGAVDTHRAATQLPAVQDRSEEHTSELQSHLNLVCRLLLEKKKQNDLVARHHGSVLVGCIQWWRMWTFSTQRP